MLIQRKVKHYCWLVDTEGKEELIWLRHRRKYDTKYIATRRPHLDFTAIVRA